MKRYYFSALLLGLAASACAHHSTQGGQQTARVAPDQTASYNTQQAERAANVFKEEPTGDEARAQAQSAGLSGYGDSAEHEKMELPAHSGNDSTASSSATVIGTGRGQSTSAATGYGTPPGSHTAPGSTRAITPTQGTAGVKPMEGEPATDESVVAGVAGAETVVVQGASSSDRSTTQRIRRAIMNDDSLSYTAKNIQIVTHDGNITLRGQVLSDKERWEIERITRGYAGSGKVDNDLSIKTP